MAAAGGDGGVAAAPAAGSRSKFGAFSEAEKPPRFFNNGRVTSALAESGAMQKFSALVEQKRKNSRHLQVRRLWYTPTSQLRDEAEALATALEIGICDVPEVIAWSDARIVREDAPPAALCEVSVSHDRYPQDVAGLLRQCRDKPVKLHVQRLLVLLLRDKLCRDRSWAGKVASALYQMALADDIEDPDLKSMAWWAWDALSLADAGHIRESREQITNQMAAALDAAARLGDAAWSSRFGH
jgi:hypothetical protein